MRLLFICGALAAGEYLASFCPQLTGTWPVAAIAATLILLFGYGWESKLMCYAATVLFGIALFLFASQDQEREYLMSPWMRGKEWRVTHRQEKQVGLAKTMKDDLSRRVGIGLESDWESASLARAILLGERRSLPYRTKRLFIESGTMHVFAISGLHVMAVAEVFTLCLAFLLVPVRFAGLVSAPLLWGYVAMIGFAPSAVRAGMMATIMGVAPVFWRRASGLRAWELTFLIVHIATPLMITNVGNALSFAVMLAIVLAGDYARSMSRWRQTLLVTVAAWATGVPISAHIFGRVTPGGMIGNLVLIATAKLTVVSGAFGVLASYVSETLAAHVNNLSALGIKSMVLVAEGVSRLPGANFETGTWSLLTCIEWYVALALIGFLIWKVTERRRALG